MNDRRTYRNLPTTWNPEPKNLCYCDIIRLEMERRGFGVKYIDGFVKQIKT